MQHDANYKFQGLLLPRRVYGLESTGATKGYGMVYNHVSTDASAVTIEDLARGKYVNAPTVTLNKYFAGVVTQGRSDKGVLEIATPGSDCHIYCGETSASAGQIVYCDCGDNAGKFYLGGDGRTLGAAILLEDVSAAGLVHAKLIDGEDRGLLQMLTPVLAGAAIVPTAEGVTLINGGTVDTANITATLANGTVIGQRKTVKITTTVGNSKNFVYTCTTAVQMDGSTALATVTMNTAAEIFTVEWMGTQWQLISYKGATLA